MVFVFRPLSILFPEQRGQVGSLLVLYTQFDRKLSDLQRRKHNLLLPKDIRQRISRYRRWQDRQATLFGRLLLFEGLQRLGWAGDCLDLIKIDDNGRPYIDGNIDFNVSHSGEYVLCALSDRGRVGVDIEKKQEIDISFYKKYIHDLHWQEIVSSQYPQEVFFEKWSKLESLIKADGRGMGLSTRDIYIDNDEVFLDGVRWHLLSLRQFDGYSCALASNFYCDSIELIKYYFK